MKIKIKPFALRLLKENLIYLIAFILLVFILILFLVNHYPKFEQNQQKIKTLRQQIKELQNELSLINSLSNNPTELEEDIKFIKTLIPGEEDYFSIIYALEQLSLKTGFIINSYTVNIKDSNNDKLSLLVTGMGDKETFLNFLKNYNFGGGRLITSDKIELSQEAAESIKINLTFYNKDVSNEKMPMIDKRGMFLTQLRALKDKVQFSFKESSSPAEVDYNYQRKSNPF